MTKRRTNIREIAKLAGVSVASVSRALKDEEAHKVSSELRQKILAICEELQYSPNMHTVRMFTQKANNVAFIYPPFEDLHDELNHGQMDPNLAACINGAEEYLSSQGIYLTLTSTTEKFLTRKEYLKISRSKMVDGVLVWGWIDGEGYINELQRENVPLVMIQSAPGNQDFNSVLADDWVGMQRIVQYVIDAGHRKLAVALASQTSSTGKARAESVKAALKNYDVDVYFTQCQGFGPDFGYKSCCEIFDNAPGTTCIIAPNDTAVIGIYKAARERGIHIPDDISVTGADGVKLISPIQFTSYLSPSYEIGRRGAELLLKKIENPTSEPEQYVLPVSLIEGETVALLNHTENDGEI